MQQGCKVLWPGKEDYYSLMQQMTTLGRRAFYKEKQNEPSAAGDLFFDLERAVRFHLVEDNIIIQKSGTGGSLVSEGQAKQEEPQAIVPPRAPNSSGSESAPLSLKNLTIAGFLDSALGKGSSKKEGDFAAIVTVGLDAAGYLYLLDVWCQRCPPTRQVNQIFNLHNLWNYSLFGIEANCFQSLLMIPIEEERHSRRASKLPWQVAVREVHHSTSKEMRIASLEPLLSNGWLRLSASLPELFWRQLESFPRCEHDDALDALEGAVSLLRSLKIEVKAGPVRASARKLANF